MSKHRGTKDHQDKARRQLVRAQLELHTAQEKRAQAISRAERDIEQAKERGIKRVAKATERVERRAGDMARAEARLLSSSKPKQPKQAMAAPVDGHSSPGRSGAGSTARSVAAPTHLPDTPPAGQIHAGKRRRTGSVIVPDGAASEPSSPLNGTDLTHDHPTVQ